MTAYRAVTPRIVAADPAGLVAWLIEVFGAAGEVVEGRPTDVVIGDSIVLVSGAGEARDEFPAFLYVYVDDADATFASAVAAGCQVLEPPIDTPYGDRRAMVKDPHGNTFQIAHHRSGLAPDRGARQPHSGASSASFWRPIEVGAPHQAPERMARSRWSVPARSWKISWSVKEWTR